MKIYFKKSWYKGKYRNISIEKYPGFYRPGSIPYFSGDTLRKYADFIFDETQSFNPRNVKKNNIIFVKTDLLEIYFSYYHKKIDSKYILVTHNSDSAVTKAETKFLDDKIIHWFAMKLDFPSNEKISPIPIGLENKRFLTNGKIKNFKKVEKKVRIGFEKYDKKILCSFNVHTNFNERKPLIEKVKNNNLYDIRKFTSNYEYLTELSKYRFILCPEGNNFESHRIWESLIFNCTPIVRSNMVNTNLFNLGVPLLIIDDWSYLNGLTFDDLVNLNQININKEYRKFSTWKYWKELIDSKTL